MSQKSFQDHYPDVLAHCYGCGRLNEHGHHIKSYWDGDESVCHFLPKPYHIAIPGYVYGGLLASLIDCHGTGTAAAALYKAAKKQNPNTEANTRTLTASLHVDYLKPTPLGIELEVREIPGHSPGHVVYVVKGTDPVIVLGGDVLFAGSVGRTDFPDGDAAELAASIRDKLFTLPDDAIVLTGHGPPTTTGREKRNNPYVGRGGMLM